MPKRCMNDARMDDLPPGGTGGPFILRDLGATFILRDDESGSAGARQRWSAAAAAARS